MNARQLEIFIKQAFQAERWAGEILEEVRPALVAAMAEVRRIVGQLPDESLIRQMEWRRRYLPLVEDAIRPYNDALAQAVVQKMTEVWGMEWGMEVVQKMAEVWGMEIV